MLEVEAVPQSCIPKVEIGLGIALYLRSLLFIERFAFGMGFYQEHKQGNFGGGY
jgi:hypothetical protein